MVIAVMAPFETGPNEENAVGNDDREKKAHCLQKRGVQPWRS